MIPHHSFVGGHPPDGGGGGEQGGEEGGAPSKLVKVGHKLMLIDFD